MNPKHKSDQRYNYVFTFMMRSFLIAKQKIQNEIQKIGLSSINDITIDQYLLNSLDKNLEILTSKENEQLSNDYYEDTLNLALSNQQSNDLLNDLTNNNDLNQLFKLTDYDKENLNEDVLLKLPQHFDNYIINLIKLLKDAFESNTNQDLKILTERNVDLSNQLKDELNSKNTLVQKLIEAEDRALINLKKVDLYEEELKNLEELKRENDNLKQQLRKYNSEYRNFTKEKEELEKRILLFNENLPDLQKTTCSKLISKNLCSYTALLSEELKNDLDQSRVQIELTERQRDDILSQLTNLKKEKDKLDELNLRLRKELELQKENFENELKLNKKQLDNQKRFIDSQTEERENEIDEYIAKLNKLEDKLRDKEIKESNYLEKIRHYEEQIEFINEEKSKLDKCYKETCNRLTNELKKNKQLLETLEEKERIKEQTDQIKQELEERIAKIEEDLNNQLKINETLRKDKTEQSKLLINSFVDNVCESMNDNNDIEQLRCSTNQQSFFNEQSNLIQQTIDEKLNNFTIDESSTFYDDQKLIEGNLRLVSCVEKCVKTNQDLNDELEEAKSQNSNLNKKITNLENQIENYKLKLEEMSKEGKILKELCSEKNLKLNELQNQLKERSNDNENKDQLKQSIDCLEKKLKEEELKIKELNDKVKRTELKLNKKQEENYKILNEVEKVKIDNNQLEKNYQLLQKAKKKLDKERSKLLQEIEDLQNERDDLDDQSDIREMFETVLQDKDEEIDNLNCCLNEINAKLRECLPASTFGQNSLILLDELISNYKKFLRTSNHHLQNNRLSHQTRFHQTRLESESYSSFSPIESLNDDIQNDDLNDDDEFDDEIRNKLNGIHNNSLEIHNLSIYLKNEQSLIKLINEIPDIVTNDNLTRSKINDWKFNFIDCFSNKNIGELLTKIIISLRTPFLDNQATKLRSDLEKDELIKQIEMYKDKLRKGQLELRKCNSKRKELIFQKKYLLNINKPNHCHHHHHQFNCQPYNNYYQSNRTNKFNRFKIVSLSLIAVLRIRKLRKIREFNENNEQLINKLDQFKLKNNLMPNVLNPSIEKFSSFINSLNPSTNQLKNKVPLNHHSNHDFNNKDNEPRLKDLYDNLKKVNHNLGFQSSSLGSSTCSSLSNFN